MRVDCTKTLVRLRNNGAWSIYHGLQNRLDFQNWHHLTGGAAYTWSKSLDNVSEIFSTFAGGTTIAGAQNPFDPNGSERGVGGTSYKHVASVYWNYDIPVMTSQQGFLGHILGGWQASGVWRYRSGEPFNVIQFGESTYCDSAFYNGFFSGGDTCRPILSNAAAPLDSVGLCTSATAANCGLTDFNSGTAIAASGVHWIVNNNTAAKFFGSPYKGVGRDTLFAQAFNQLDFGVIKETKVTERVRLHFQANANNILNHMYLGTPDPLIEDGTFNLDKSSPGFNSGGSFMNKFFNTQPASNRRRLSFGMKLLF